MFFKDIKCDFEIFLVANLHLVRIGHIGQKSTHAGDEQHEMQSYVEGILPNRRN